MALFSLLRKPQYHILSPSQSDLDEGEKEPKSLGQSRVSQSGFGGIGFWSIVICLVCTIVNAVLLRSGQSSASYMNTIASVTRADMAKLRRPNQFIGLDKVKRPFPPEPKTTTNYPIVLAIVDSERPTGVFSDDPKRHMTWKGMISPEERKVEVSKSVSTIVQFRTIDWGFESCSLTMRIPPRSMAYLPPEKFAINSSLIIGPDFNHFELFRLDASEMPLDTKTLSYNTKPKALEKLATVSVDFGMEWKWDFPCERDSLHAFELRAASGLTRFEWWQDKEIESPVLYLQQHATA